MEELLRALGPYTTPLNIVLLAGLGWLARERARMWQALETAQKALIEEKEKRAELLDRNYQEFLERGEVMIETITDFNKAAGEILAKAKNSRKLDRATRDDRDR